MLSNFNDLEECWDIDAVSITPIKPGMDRSEQYHDLELCTPHRLQLDSVQADGCPDGKPSGGFSVLTLDPLILVGGAANAMAQELAQD